MTNDNRLQEFKKAIFFLKRTERIRNNTDVAVAMDISSSYLSQMIHGNKPFTDAFFKKFESHYKINLNDPFSYTDLDWVTDTPDKKSPAPDNSKELFNSMKELLTVKEKETENQKKIINAQQQLINNLNKELEILKRLVK